MIRLPQTNEHHLRPTVADSSHARTILFGIVGHLAW